MDYSLPPELWESAQSLTNWKQYHLPTVLDNTFSKHEALDREPELQSCLELAHSHVFTRVQKT